MECKIVTALEGEGRKSDCMSRARSAIRVPSGDASLLSEQCYDIGVIPEHRLRPSKQIRLTYADAELEGFRYMEAMDEAGISMLSEGSRGLAVTGAKSHA